MKDIQAALGDSDVHSIFGTDADGHSRFRKNDKVVSMNRTLVLDRVILHLKIKDNHHLLMHNPGLILILPCITQLNKDPTIFG